MPLNCTLCIHADGHRAENAFSDVEDSFQLNGEIAICGVLHYNVVTVENTDEWGKRRMAYPIDDVNDGYYVVMQYTADRDFPVELERRFSITEGILRSMTIRIDA